MQSQKNNKDMATYTVTINERTNIGKQLVAFLKGIGAIKDEKKGTLDQALKDVEEGRVYTAESVEDMMKQILG